MTPNPLQTHIGAAFEEWFLPGRVSRTDAKTSFTAGYSAALKLVREEVEKMCPIDTEEKGWEILEDRCCPGDDAGFGYVRALDDIKKLLGEYGGEKEGD